VHGLLQIYYRLKNYFRHIRWYSCLMRLKWKLISFHLEIVLTLTQDRCTVAPNVPWTQKSFWTHPMELLGDVGHGELYFGQFGDGVIVSAR
jgi:hypothetical protein